MYEYNLQTWPSSKNPIIQLYIHETPLDVSFYITPVFLSSKMGDSFVQNGPGPNGPPGGGGGPPHPCLCP